jgi:hypothetical protein
VASTRGEAADLLYDALDDERHAVSVFAARRVPDVNGSEQQRVAWALSRVRNDLAHRNRGYDTFALHETVGVLERIAFVRHHAGLGGGRIAMDQRRVGRPAQLLVLHRPPPPGHGRMGVTLMSTAFAFPPTA